MKENNATMTSQKSNRKMHWPDLACGSAGFRRERQGNPQDEASKEQSPARWGSTISFTPDDSLGDDTPRHQQHATYPKSNIPQHQDSPAGSRQKSSSAGGSGNTNPNQASSSSDQSFCQQTPQRYSAGNAKPDRPDVEEEASMDRLWKQTVGTFWSSPTTAPNSTNNFTVAAAQIQLIQWTDLLQEACVACVPRDLSTEWILEETSAPAAPPPTPVISSATTNAKQNRTHEEIEVSPTHHIQVRLPPTNGEQHVKPGSSPKKSTSKDKNNNKKKDIPLHTLEVKKDEAVALERSISELTMRSSYATAQAANSIQKQQEVLKTVPPEKSRRMAYYAVGKHHRNAGRGGNRRCYFTGKLILGGAPFYAGSVQQGLRTLVVFCLPSAVGLPDKDALLKFSTTVGAATTATTSRKSLSSRNSIVSVQPILQNNRIGTGTTSSSALKSVGSGSGGGPRSALHMDTARGVLLRAAGRSGAVSVASKSMTSKASMLSSLEDLSLSIDGDLDPNWGLDRDVMLAVLPAASPSLLKQMADHYPEQFETLPVQVRQANVWKLYVKFCFFSGLPIAEGELHYKVMDDIAEQVYGEEIALSHDVLEASTGKSSADILTLPNRTVLKYLRKHYSQQCSKLEDRVFERASWERVAPEV